MGQVALEEQGSDSEANPEQAALLGTQVRVLVLVPFPHPVEQGVKAVQSPQVLFSGSQRFEELLVVASAKNNLLVLRWGAINVTVLVPYQKRTLFICKKMKCPKRSSFSSETR